ncbi:hypothetical protein RSAG8_09295, partial [Rhizoctonia solani AG-8 WAC10335]
MIAKPGRSVRARRNCAHVQVYASDRLGASVVKINGEYFFPHKYQPCKTERFCVLGNLCSTIPWIGV